MEVKCPYCGFQGPRPLFKRIRGDPHAKWRCPRCFEGFDPEEETEER